MPCVSLRGETKDKFQEHCKKNKTSMSKELDRILQLDKKFKDFIEKK